MRTSDIQRARDAATATVRTSGLRADDAVVVSNSNKVALRLLPADILARVAPIADQNLQFEVDVSRRLLELGSPVAELDPRVEPFVHERDGFVMTFWTYHEPAPDRAIAAADYARALRDLHGGMRQIDWLTPHFTDRVDEAQALVSDPERTPELHHDDRVFLARVLESSRAAIVGRKKREQLLHGEPHPGNLLATARGPVFIDFETCCRGPVEFDLAHAPPEISEWYPDVDHELLRECRILMLAMIIMWRWDRGDQLPHGRELAAEWMRQLREEGGRRRSSTRLPR